MTQQQETESKQTAFDHLIDAQVHLSKAIELLDDDDQIASKIMAVQIQLAMLANLLPIEDDE
jgi:hypothetical protein